MMRVKVRISPIEPGRGRDSIKTVRRINALIDPGTTNSIIIFNSLPVNIQQAMAFFTRNPHSSQPNVHNIRQFKNVLVSTINGEKATNNCVSIKLMVHNGAWFGECEFVVLEHKSEACLLGAPF